MLPRRCPGRNFMPTRPLPRKANLNDRMLKTLPPAREGRRYDIMDTIVPGFGIRVTDKSAKDSGGKIRAATKTFILTARYPGFSQPTRGVLGSYGALTLETARDKARGWIELIKKSIDPREKEKQERVAEQQKRKNTFAAVAEDFIAEKLPGERKGKEVERDLRRQLIPVLGDLPITV